MRIPPVFASKSFTSERIAFAPTELPAKTLPDANGVLPEETTVLAVGTLTAKGSTTSLCFCVPPRIARTSTGPVKPGIVQRPPGLEKASSFSESGQP